MGPSFFFHSLCHCHKLPKKYKSFNQLQVLASYNFNGLQLAGCAANPTALPLSLDQITLEI